MEKTNLDYDWNYAHYTFMGGHRPFYGIEMMLSNMIKNFKEVTSHPCGSFSTTQDCIGRNAISDTAVVMSYSLLEGFFHEEFDFYLKKKNKRKPKELSALIGQLLNEHNISIKEWRSRKKLIDSLRILRNAVTHCNGIVEIEIDKEKYIRIFGEDIFEGDKGYPRFSFEGSLWLLNELQSIAYEYSKEVFDKASKILP